MWDHSGPGIKPVSPALAGRFFTTEPPGKPVSLFKCWLTVAYMSQRVEWGGACLLWRAAPSLCWKGILFSGLSGESCMEQQGWKPSPTLQPPLVVSMEKDVTARLCMSAQPDGCVCITGWWGGGWGRLSEIGTQEGRKWLNWWLLLFGLPATPTCCHLQGLWSGLQELQWGQRRPLWPFRPCAWDS